MTVETYDSFKEVSRRASQLAARLGRTMAVDRDGSRFSIVVPTEVTLAEQRQSDQERMAADLKIAAITDCGEEGRWAAEDAKWERLQEEANRDHMEGYREALDDIRDAQDSMAEREESGWYYGD